MATGESGAALIVTSLTAWVSVFSPFPPENPTRTSGPTVTGVENSAIPSIATVSVPFTRVTRKTWVVPQGCDRRVGGQPVEFARRARGDRTVR